MAGPATVFASANVLTDKVLYRVSIVSAGGQMVPCSIGTRIETGALHEASARDTVMVVGAEANALRAALHDKTLLTWLRRSAAAGARIASVCTGAFVLGRAGLLDQKRATTHWAARSDLAQFVPAANVESDALYVADGDIWTSAGITTGIDMALAIVGRDHGAAMMHDVSRRMVIYAHRPGTQSQFSRLLTTQRTAPSALSDLLAHIDSHLADDLTLGTLAQIASMSERTLHRKFVQATKLTPAKYVEAVRMERACLLLEQGVSVKQIANEVGYKTEQGFRAAFEAVYGIPPSLHQRLHSDPDKRFSKVSR